jgi:hypothetical protein
MGIGKRAPTVGAVTLDLVSGVRDEDYFDKYDFVVEWN